MGGKLFVLRRDFEKHLRQLGDRYEGFEFYWSAYDNNVIGISRDGGEFVVGPEQNPRRYAAADLISVEILQDDRTDFYHGFAYLTAAISGATQQRRGVSSIDLKIVVRDREQPVYRVRFFESAYGQGSKPRSAMVVNNAKLVERFHALLISRLVP